MLSGRRLSADEALAWGLVSEVVPAADLPARAAEQAATLAAMATGAIAMHKRLFDLAARTTLDEQLELEAQMQSAAARSADFAEGVAAFREKRPPRFGGGCSLPGYFAPTRTALVRRAMARRVLSGAGRPSQSISDPCQDENWMSAISRSSARMSALFIVIQPPCESLPSLLITASPLSWSRL